MKMLLLLAMGVTLGLNPASAEAASPGAFERCASLLNRALGRQPAPVIPAKAQVINTLRNLFGKKNDGFLWGTNPELDPSLSSEYGNAALVAVQINNKTEHGGPWASIKAYNAKDYHSGFFIFPGRIDDLHSFHLRDADVQSVTRFEETRDRVFIEVRKEKSERYYYGAYGFHRKQRLQIDLRDGAIVSVTVSNLNPVFGTFGLVNRWTHLKVDLDGAYSPAVYYENR